MKDSPGGRFTWSLLGSPIKAAVGGEAELDPWKQGSGVDIQKSGHICPSKKSNLFTLHKAYAEKIQGISCREGSPCFSRAPWPETSSLLKYCLLYNTVGCIFEWLKHFGNPWLKLVYLYGSTHIVWPGFMTPDQDDQKRHIHYYC